MPKRLDLTGRTFGYLRAIRFCGVDHNGKALWKCECICSSIKEYSSNRLIVGDAKSCGCMQHAAMKKHGLSKNFRPYTIWKGMKQRCLNPNFKQYKDYGGRGIKVCPKWSDSFLSFWNDMKSTYADTLSIDRIDNDKGYSKSNCRWSTSEEQNNNKRPRNRAITGLS